MKLLVSIVTFVLVVCAAGLLALAVFVYGGGWQ